MDANKGKVDLNGTPPMLNRDQTKNDLRESKLDVSLNSNEIHNNNNANNNSFNESNDYSVNTNPKYDSVNNTERKNKGFSQQVSFKDEINSVTSNRLTPLKNRKPDFKNPEKLNENQPKKGSKC